MLSFADINFVAVIVTTLACMALGFVWYSPAAFGTKWMQLTGMTKKDAESGMAKAMQTGLLATFISVLFLAVLHSLMGPAHIKDALTFGFILWAALVFPNELHGCAWEKRPFALLAINAGNSLVTILMTIAILHAWS